MAIGDVADMSGPGRRQLRDIGLVDLRQRRKPLSAGVAPIDRPAIVGWLLRSGDRRQPDRQDDQGRGQAKSSTRGLVFGSAIPQCRGQVSLSGLTANTIDGVIASNPEPRAGRRRIWDGWRGGGTSGDDAGTNGGLIVGLLPAYLAVAVFIFGINSVNVLSQLDEAARDGRALAAWIPIAKELSSAIGVMLSCGLAYGALRLAPPGRAPWPRLALVQLAGSIAFSGAHQAVMSGLRIVIFAAHGLAYHRPPLPADLLYEYRKDLVGYVIITGLFWQFKAPGLRAPASEMERPLEAAASDAATFDIVDGGKILRVPVGWILAARSVGNYVEFLLEDGRKPLMRASLTRVETALASRGLLRTHRSWLINPDHLRSLEATGSGDYRLGLDGDVQVPLSRRFPATLDQLRRGGKWG